MRNKTITAVLCTSLIAFYTYCFCHFFVKYRLDRLTVLMPKLKGLQSMIPLNPIYRTETKSKTVRKLSSSNVLKSGVIEMGMIKPFYENNYAIQNAARLVLGREESIRLFEYSSPLGTKRQINAARKWLHRIGVSAGKENVLLSAGAQNALSIILISLFNAGDKIAVDNFTYTNFKGLANFLHIQLIAVPADGYGMSPDGLLTICKNTGIKGIYLMPTCSNPTSIFMPQSRRMELAQIIKRFHLLVIEDDIYSFLSVYGHTAPDAKPFLSTVRSLQHLSRAGKQKTL